MPNSFLGLDVARWTAIATLVTGIATVALVTVTAVYVRQTRKLVEANQKSATAAIESLKLQRTMAIIGSSPFILTTKDIRSGKLQLFVRNIGTSEAHDITLGVELDGESLGTRSLTTIGPGANPRTISLDVTSEQAHTIQTRSAVLRISAEFSGPTGQRLVTERKYRRDRTQETRLLTDSGTLLSADFGPD